MAKTHATRRFPQSYYSRTILVQALNPENAFVITTNLLRLLRICYNLMTAREDSIGQICGTDFSRPQSLTGRCLASMPVMKVFPFALYDAFSATVFGGSQAAVITDAKTINTADRQRIAREIGMPATAFVDDYGDDWIQVQFMSTVMELPMCGHGTICLLTHLLETGRIRLDQQSTSQVELRLPQSTAITESSLRSDDRYQVMLDIEPPRFEAPPPHTGSLLKTLGLEASALANDLPLETARGDFIHLVVPLAGLEAMRAIEPDFNGMIEFCQAYGVETIAVFCGEVESSVNRIHVRDFCPAVGVSESAAAGTTNAALTSYLVRHELVPVDTDVITVNAEQGLELGRPSSIQSCVTLSGQEINRLQVGGVATRVLDGQVYL